MRPLLSPGLHVLRRADGTLQVGLSPETAVLLPDDEDVRRNLRRLSRGEADLSDVPEALHPLLRTPPPTATGRVVVTGFGHRAGASLPARLRSLLEATGLPPARSEPDLVVLAGVGEPARETVDRLTQAGTPYLLLRLVEGEVLLGPFVVPGRTACVRCTDAAVTEEDASWPLLVEQYTRLSAHDRPDGSSEPFDPLLAELACAWTVRDVATFLTGHRPSTWSATLRLDRLLQVIETTQWLRHPSCGCSWTMTV